jgi:hypothetical protein
MNVRKGTTASSPEAKAVEIWHVEGHCSWPLSDESGVEFQSGVAMNGLRRWQYSKCA